MKRNPELHQGSMFRAEAEVSGDRVSFCISVSRIVPGREVHIVHVDEQGYLIPGRAKEFAPLRDIMAGRFGMMRLTPIEPKLGNSLDTTEDVV